MLERTLTKISARFARAARGVLSLTLVFLLIEFFDELSFAVDGVALPAIRAELGLTYSQVGLLLGVPGLVATLVEPAIMLLGDTHLRKRLVVAGGLAFAFSLALVASASTFTMLLVAFILGSPASGAFVTLSQATLMDLNRGREPHLMARWTLAGSLGNLLGPLFLAAGFTLALGWRWAFASLAVFGLSLTVLVITRPFPASRASQDQAPTSEVLLRNLWEAVGNPNLLRWLGLMEMSDLMLDILFGYAALYFTDVAGATPAQASLILGAAVVASLASDVALIRLLERLPGRALVRASAVPAAGLYVTFLLAPWMWAKVVLLLLVRFSTLGWYSVLQGEAYAALPGRSGTVMAVNALTGLVGSFQVWFIGWLAGLVGLPFAMWYLLLGPLCLALFVPKPTKTVPSLSKVHRG